MVVKEESVPGFVDSARRRARVEGGQRAKNGQEKENVNVNERAKPYTQSSPRRQKRMERERERRKREREEQTSDECQGSVGAHCVRTRRYTGGEERRASNTEFTGKRRAREETRGEARRRALYVGVCVGGCVVWGYVDMCEADGIWRYEAWDMGDTGYAEKILNTNGTQKTSTKKERQRWATGMYATTEKSSNNKRTRQSYTGSRRMDGWSSVQESTETWTWNGNGNVHTEQTTYT
ncbi:hypothetical protein C8T65DRAFT_82065 [Cerioporus squamosus]|nr:hypothetical protein C8T65DRAFT_82065 [Cerioporus squamosus]